MKRQSSIISKIMVVSFIILFCFQNSFYAQKTIRIGTYDSRAVAVAFFNSDYGTSTMEIMKQLHVDHQKATEEKDTLKVKKLEREGQMRQAILHEQGFGTGSVRQCMLAIKGKVDSLAVIENLDIIVSKWELNFSASDIEIVDVTEKLANLFQPKMKIEDMLKGLLSSEPIEEAYLLDD